MDKAQELFHYINKKEFKRFNEAWLNKYIKLGYLSGSIKLNNLTDLEKEVLGGFLGKDLSNGSLSLTFARFQKILNSTKYEGVDFVEVLYHLQPQLMTNAEKKLEEEQKNELFKKEVLKAVKDKKWLINYFENDPSCKKFFNQQEELITIAKCLECLPVDYDTQETLAVFSQKHTGNPHYFDSGLFRDTLLKGICFAKSLPAVFENAQDINKIFLTAGIIKDTLSNYCVIFHLNGNNEIYKSFYSLYEPWNINYNNLLTINNQFEKQVVYIVENPSVFSYLCDVVKENKLDVGRVLSNGQINLCTYELLDRLYERNCELYYAGDFDPEGLLIADKLKERYPRLNLWCYTEALFEKVKVKIHISNRRKEMMKNLKDKVLVHLGEIIADKNRVGYQEGLLAVYESDIKVKN